ncbi:MAG: hypothetical protein K2N23_08045, partial [Clostridia bacterium]|nr:hypothetical protein [Clostridia bacterium]
MDEKLKRFIITTAFKIAYFEKQPQSDEQFFKSKATLSEAYIKAKRNYLLTSDESYVAAMKNVKKLQKLNVSKTEYEQCIKIIRGLKTQFSDECYDGIWAEISTYSQNG